MFWSLFIFCRHSTQEPASTTCDDKGGDLFYSTGQHEKLCQPKLTLLKGREMKKKFWRKQMKVNGPGMSKLGQVSHSCEWWSMHGYILTYFRLYRENACQLWVLNWGDLNFSVSWWKILSHLTDVSPENSLIWGQESPCLPSPPPPHF